MTEHTPGPWRVTVGGTIGALWNSVSHRFGHIVACVYPCGRDTVEARANAYLIAAAPDLLKALEAEDAWQKHQHSCARCGSMFPGTQLCEDGSRLWHLSLELRPAALAKAKGE